MTEIIDRPKTYDRSMTDHIGLMHTIARRVGISDVEDFVQEVCAEMMRRWSTYDSAQYKFSTWVWTVAMNIHSRDMRRAMAKKRHVKTVAFDDKYGQSTGPCQHDYAELSEVLRNLSGTRDSEVLMRIAMGDELSEVASDLGISRERVRQLAARERDRLQTARAA